MKCKDSNFWIGLGIGSVAGALAYHFSRTEKAKKLEDAKELVAYSLKDNGCIAYDVFESATRSDVLMICETWKDAESLSAHEKADHFVALVPKIQGLAAMKLEKFEF